MTGQRKTCIYEGVEGVAGELNQHPLLIGATWIGMSIAGRVHCRMNRTRRVAE